MGTLTNNIYYSLKPIIPRPLQIFLRRIVVSRKKALHRDTWPIDEKAGTQPDGWDGWPDGKRFALVLTHDVETAKGHDSCRDLMELEEDFGLHSSFNFVPERYTVSAELRRHIANKGFEVGVHGLYHDGKLYRSKSKFRGRASKINRYLSEWGSVGFSSPSMQNNLEWTHDLNIAYDSSTFDTDPFEPQNEGVGTIFPFWVKNKANGKGYVELPFTLPQDFTLFVLMKDESISIWKEKLEWIAGHGGMALLITHPDYMNFKKSGCKTEEYPVELYKELLGHINNNYKDQYWNPLPREMASFWKNRCERQAG
jgi:hypothetical protein